MAENRRQHDPESDATVVRIGVDAIPPEDAAVKVPVLVTPAPQPTFLAGKYLMVGAQPYEELKRLIEHVLKEPDSQRAGSQLN